MTPGLERLRLGEGERERTRKRGRQERRRISLKERGGVCHRIIKSNNLIRIFSDFEVLIV